MSEWIRARCESGNCVEVKAGMAIVLIRSSDDRRKLVGMTRAEWAVFVAAVKAGEFDTV